MNSEKKSSCETCQGVFANDHELSMHDCVEIKKEPQDLKDLSEPRDQDHLDKENFKEELSDPEKQQHFNEKSNHDLENEEDKPLRKKRHKREKRKSRRVLQNLNFPEPHANLPENYHDLDLSVEFLSQVFKYVDELCEYINNGDQNLDRSSVVIQNLNYAVSCYRVNLTEPKPDIQEDFQEDQEDFKYEIDPPVDFPSNDEDEEYKEPKPKKKKIKKKTDRKSEIKEETNGTDTFQDETGKKKRKWERKGKPVVEIKIEKLLSFMNMTENKFSCKFCDQTYNTGPHLFTHLNATHYSEIKAKIDSGNFELVNFDCINANCKKLYGYKNRDLWCGLCTTSFKRYNVVNAMKNKKEPELCPDCGKYVTNLKVHQQTTHSVGKETCPHCNLTGIKYLNAHIQAVHEKIPCDQCGKLIGMNFMYRHVQTQHTVNEDKRYKCEVCGKGFHLLTAFNDHKNIHTGEKPYKCKICNNGFAKRNTLNSHVAAVHEGKKPYLCTLCGKAWAERSNLKKHIDMVHKGIKRIMKKDKNHRCTICSASFHQNNALKMHIAAVHEGKKPYTCNLCGVSFAWKNNLTKHIDGVHRGIKKQPKKKIQVFEQNKNKNLKDMQY